MRKSGKYIVEKRIASGGMAEVFRVLYKGPHDFEKRYALKQILPEYSKNKDFVESLISEANINVRLNHENIVQIYELGHEEGSYYILMEYIEGIDLNDLFESAATTEVAIPVPLALSIIRQICKGLEN